MAKQHVIYSLLLPRLKSIASLHKALRFPAFLQRCEAEVLYHANFQSCLLIH